MKACIISMLLLFACPLTAKGGKTTIKVSSRITNCYTILVKLLGEPIPRKTDPFTPSVSWKLGKGTLEIHHSMGIGYISKITFLEPDKTGKLNPESREVKSIQISGNKLTIVYEHDDKTESKSFLVKPPNK